MAEQVVMAVNTKVDIIIDGLRSRILSGEFGDEGRLPSFRKLVSEYETSQETMNKAMQSLQAEGLLLSAGAKGVFVSKPRIRIPGMVSGFYEDILKNEGTPIGVSIKPPEIITPSKDLAKKMKLSKNDKVLLRTRKQGANGIIFRLAEEYYPMSLITEKMLEQINNDIHFNILVAIKENFGKMSHYTHEEIIARLPTAYEQEHLQIVRTNPIIDTRRTHFTSNRKTVITYNHRIMNANLFLLSFDFPVNYWDDK